MFAIWECPHSAPHFGFMVMRRMILLYQIIQALPEGKLSARCLSSVISGN
ncbi:MAG: hypothetical protein IKM77_09905 [Prevotella sp.]|nr:hypothetical protein [Prevotella sp.]